MALFFDPQIVPEAWDYALIAGLATPGLCEITGASLKRKWDVQKAVGSSGPATIYHGDDSQDFKMKISFFSGVLGQTDVEQRAYWEDSIMPLLLAAPSGATAAALDFSHPATNALGIKSVSVKEIGQYVQEGDGLWTITVDFIKFSKPRPAQGKPKGAKDSNKKAATVASANETRIAALRAELRNLAAR